MPQMDEAPKPLSQVIAEVDTSKGRQNLKAYLKTGPFPQYKQVSDHPELLLRIEADGTEIVGRFAGREFVPVGQRNEC